MKTKKCAFCGKKMIQWFENYVLTSNPPMRVYRWKCKCGAKTQMYHERQEMTTPGFDEQWKEANKK